VSIKKCGDYGGENRFGEPCRHSVAEGFTRCALHGAKSPAAIRKAEMALALARMPAIEHLYEMLEQYAKDTCPVCNYPKRDSEQARVEIRLCQTILDRTGLGPKASLDVNHKHSEDGLNVDHLLPDERERVLVLVTELKQIKSRVRARMMGELTAPALPSNTVEGEVIK
jgi:hypothetical protein